MPTVLKRLAVLALAWASAASADTLNGNLEPGTSVSHAYDARSVLTNPAALGYQTDLNGVNVATSQAFGLSRLPLNDYSVALSVGYFGAAAEALSTSSGRFQRYSFALGFPAALPPVLGGIPMYLGLRYALYRSDVAALGPYDSWDFGLQLRPSKYWSLGLASNRFNRPGLGGTKLPAQLVAGVTLRPVDSIELSLDVDTPSTAFAKSFGYQATASYEILHGLRLRAGYHDRLQWHAGLALSLGGLGVTSFVQPGSAAPRSFTLGLQASTLPPRSAIHARTIYRLKIDTTLDEEGAKGGLIGRDRPSLLDVLRQLEEAERQPRVTAVMVRLEQFGLGLEAAEELHEALMRVREAGKRVEVFLGNAGIREYLIASAANRIHMEAAGELRLLGLRAQRYFVKGTLDKIGVEGEFLAKGEFKSAPEMFTRKSSSPSARQAAMEELERAEKALVARLGRGRKFDRGTWDRAVGRGLFSAKDALDTGLIDHVGGFNEEYDKVRRRNVVTDDLSVASDRLTLPSRIAVVVAEGDILRRRSRLLMLGGSSQLTPEKIERQLRRAVLDRRTKAIVLRVSSPGGEILPSHEIASLVERAKKEKPVVVTMGDVAASGGYYISAPADRIFAGKLTATGSIGVFLGKFNLGGLFRKLDLQKEILGGGPFAGIESEDRAWTAEERQLMVSRLDQYYDGFVSYVAQKRNLSAADAEKAAKGRVWLGEQAKTLRLADETGGYLDAVRWAAKRVGLDHDEYEIEPLQESAGLFDLFEAETWLMRSASPWREAAATLLGDDAVRHLQWMEALRQSPFLYWSPVARFE